LAGAPAILGLRYSRAKSDAKEDVKMWKVADELFRRFRDEIVNKGGSICCLDIACVNWKDRQQAKEFYTGDKIKGCYRVVGETALLLGEILERN